VRVLLIGPAEARARLRASLNGLLQIAGEFLTLAAAEASGIEADGMLMAAERRTEDEAMPEALTPREIEVLELLAEGLPNKAIAEQLAISDQTVKFHVASIYGKLGAANRTDAVRRAVRRGLVTL
jgi:DNA-binding NarL/FixJ family response regulator